MLKKNSLSHRLSLCGLMLAMSIVIGQLFTFEIQLGPITGLKLGIAQVPIVFISAALGPVYGAFAGLADDLIRTLLSGSGAYNPIIGIFSALFYVLPGIALHSDKRRPSFFAVAASLFLSQFFFSFLAKTWTIHWFYGVALEALLPLRLVALFVTPTVLTLLLVPLLRFAENIQLLYYPAAPPKKKTVRRPSPKTQHRE